MYRGDFKVGATLNFKFTTRAFSTGAPTTLAGTPAISIYKDNSTTESTSGVTLTVDFDSRTGLNNVNIDTSSDGTFYSSGSQFQLVITAGTVGGVSVVGETIGAFSIEAVSALRPTTAGRTLDVSAGGEAGVDWANIGSPTTAQNLSATNIDTDQVVASVTGAVGSVTGAVGSVTGNVGGNVTGSVGSVTGNVGGNVTGSVGSLASQAKTDVADATWDAVLADHQDAGSTGEALDSASAAGDPWVTDLPGAYASGSAGFIVGTNLNATVSSRATSAALATVQSDTDNIQTRLPAALVSGRMDSNVGAINNTVVHGTGVLGDEWGP